MTMHDKIEEMIKEDGLDEFWKLHKKHEELMKELDRRIKEFEEQVAAY